MSSASILVRYAKCHRHDHAAVMTTA